MNIHLPESLCKITGCPPVVAVTSTTIEQALREVEDLHPCLHKRLVSDTGQPWRFLYLRTGHDGWHVEPARVG